MEESSGILQTFAASIEAHIQLYRSEEIISTISKASQSIIKALAYGNKVLLFGNGGSAADAQHIAAELVGKFAFSRPALPALALTTDTSCLTAIGNDYGFDRIFSRQIEALGKPGDIAIGISTSGESGNIIRGLQAAKYNRLTTIALTGQTGGSLKDKVNFCICAPSTNTPRIQECHILIGHVLCEIVEKALFNVSKN